MFFTEGWGAENYNDFVVSSFYGKVLHSTGMNFLFADGHAEWMRADYPEETGFYGTGAFPGFPTPPKWKQKAADKDKKPWGNEPCDQ
jgi:prepilin-type processing-associated H-X9-DG protein